MILLTSLTARVDHTATLLPNGEVLVAGGANTNGYLASAELYNPATGKWTFTGSMQTARDGHRATLLQNGQVLVAGGINVNGIVASAELYNPATGTLGTGKVLVAGGTVGYHPATINSARLYDPSTQSWASTGSMSVSRELETMTVLSNGQALVAGGEQISNGIGTFLASAELYTP